MVGFMCEKRACTLNCSLTKEILFMNCVIVYYLLQHNKRKRNSFRNFNFGTRDNEQEITKRHQNGTSGF